MSNAPKTTRNPAETQRRLIEATLRLMKRQGFGATTVDQICAEAELTKGSFFHYFDTKEAIARAAMGAFAQTGMELYAIASADPARDPLEQLHHLLDIMSGLPGKLPEDDPVVCMVGMMSQEMAGTNPAMREACAEHLNAWTGMAARMLANAKKQYRLRVNFDPVSVAWMLNSLWQGSMLVSKTQGDPRTIVSNLRHARAYVDGLFVDATRGRASRQRSAAERRKLLAQRKRNEISRRQSRASASRRRAPTS